MILSFNILFASLEVNHFCGLFVESQLPQLILSTVVCIHVDVGFFF